MSNRMQRIEGFIPDFILREALLVNPGLTSLVRTFASNQQLFLNSAARQGQLFRFQGAGAGTGARQIYDAQNRTSRPGVKARFESDPAGTDKTINDCYDFFGIVRDYYQKVHGRNSIDANGMLMKGICHYDRDYDNAFWDGEYMTFGDGDKVLFATFMLLNVAIHEMTHGVTEHAVAGGIDYWGQPGAINEHYSDAFAASAEAWFTQEDSKAYHWLIGKGLWVPAPQGSKGVRRALRDMLNPGTAYNDPSIGKDRQPADMDSYVKTSSDNGGVHINSGIPNRAFANFSQYVGGNIHEQPAKIWYAARPGLGNRPSFAQLAYHTREACAIFTGGEENELRKELDRAWSLVKVKPNKTAADNHTPSFSDAA